MHHIVSGGKCRNISNTATPSNQEKYEMGEQAYISRACLGSGNDNYLDILREWHKYGAI